MTFGEAFSIVADALMFAGTNVTEENYDGIIVKRLEASNTLDDGRTTNQTHIAITGVQMDIFPYLRSDGYFNENESDNDLKKYFITQIPVNLYETNVSYLVEGAVQTGISFNNGVKHTLTSVVRSRRKAQADQIQVSLINFDGEDFISFRKMLHAGSYFILLKKSHAFEYDCFGIIPNRGIDGDGGLQSLNNQFYKKPTNTVVNVATLGQRVINEEVRLSEGCNVLLYGVPGAGKSWTIEHEYCDNEDCMERLVFHPDYMYSDFVGQILPVVKGEDKVRYEFMPGPFTKLLKRAYSNPDKSYYLIIEEINRGNAPAIFGEIFQLLDRKDEDEFDKSGKLLYKKGTSEYGISNANIARIVYGDEEHKVRIPANMSILGTMNTSDQNVFTLDTAFQRRWIMRMIPNSFNNHKFADKKILDTDISWRQFCEAINEEILRRNNITSSEDKRLGAYFISASDLEMKPITDEMSEKEKIRVEHSNSRFAEKVLKYLWDDAFKFSHQDTFNTRQFGSLEKVIEGFMNPAKPKNERFRVFNENLQKMILDGVTPESNEVSDDDSEGSQES